MHMAESGNLNSLLSSPLVGLHRVPFIPVASVPFSYALDGVRAAARKGQHNIMDEYLNTYTHTCTPNRRQFLYTNYTS